MRKLITAMFYLLLIYVVLQVAMLYIRSGHEVFYTFESDGHHFDITEEFVVDGRQSHYFLTIEVNEEETFYIQTYQNFRRAEEIVRDVVYYENNDIQCILPIFIFEATHTDVTCHYQDLVYDYRSIHGEDAELDRFVFELRHRYDLDNFQDVSETYVRDYVTTYIDNVLANHYVFFTKYRGIGTISVDNIRRYADVEVFRNDVYEMDLKILVDRHLLIANYNQSGDFNRFWKVNLISNDVDEINIDRQISFNSYFQGVDDGLAYLYDRDSRRQWQINVGSGNIKEVGNQDLGVKILIGDEWEMVTTAELANEDIYFQPNKLEDFQVPAQFDGYKAVMGENGYIYYYENIGDRYRIYRAPTRKPDYQKYLFTIEDPENIVLVYDYVYFRDGDLILYYNDSRGLKKLIENREFSFNESLDFGVYVRR